MTTSTPAAQHTVVDPAPRPVGGRVVLKIGTTSLVTDGELDPVKLRRVCEAVRAAIAEGLAPVLVTSGAIAIGRTTHPGLAAHRPHETDLPDLVRQQVAAAMGQSLLYRAIEHELGRHGLRTAQLLLTPPDLIEPAGTDLARTVDAMLDLGVVPVANENDALGVRNNDVLAALLAGFIGAELLLLLTNVPGLYDGDPAGGDAALITDVPLLNAEVEALAGDSSGAGTGGMRIKLAACWIATFRGVRVVIADTTDPAVVLDAWRGAPVGTAFRPRRPGRTPSIGALWRAFRTPPAAVLACTHEGVAALLSGAPVLARHLVDPATAAGVLAGQVLELTDPAGRGLARGAAAADGTRLRTDPTVVAVRDHVLITEEPR
ncbi:glutamate 5-kinase [Labedaea rhizosphaerae]|uniref:Glutamate 5-kinase n=1 Tax=Labedaea rhizosphaerae TaxID=598644 RepID=A0A4R6S2G8_LABRH|nr:glutamate 5-kinase [Labedaea rhizosphaerae]TDP92855.1 glutamate 5-kinase [Labedaea rhizosphaerae]